jgi:hypothetical protein
MNGGEPQAAAGAPAVLRCHCGARKRILLIALPHAAGLAVVAIVT